MLTGDKVNKKENFEKKTFIINVLYYGIILVFGYLALKYLLPVLVPFLVAFFVVWALKFPSDFVAQKLKCGNKWILRFFLTVFWCGVAFGVLKISANVLPMIGNFFLGLPDFYAKKLMPAIQIAYHHIRDVLKNGNQDVILSLETIFEQIFAEIGNFISDSSGSIIKAVSGYAASVPSVVIKIIITVISSYFMAGDFEGMLGVVLGTLPDHWKEWVIRIANQTKNIIGILLRSYSLLMLITFCELFLGLWLLKIPYAGWIAIAIAVFDILPILGTGGILIPWAIVAALLGDYKMAVGIAVLYLIITVIRNTLEPRLVGKQIGLHPLATLISMFVGARLFGLMGLVGFPLALSLYVKMKKME